VPTQERQSQAEALGTWFFQPQVLDECGLVAPGDPRLSAQGATVTLPRIDALETTRRVATDGEVHFETVAVVTQVAHVRRQGKEPGFSFVGGCTLLFSPQGVLRFAVSKSVAGDQRIERRRSFITGGSAVALRYWHEVQGSMQLRPQWSRLMHGDEVEGL
jgi:hypothetical protein